MGRVMVGYKGWKGWRVLGCLVMVFSLLLQFAPISVGAVWDGSGDTSGDSGVGAVSGSFSMRNGSVEDVLGYRFSIYDGDGAKLGDSIDIARKKWTFAYFYVIDSSNKQSHVDLYRAYSDFAAGLGDAVTIGEPVQLRMADLNADSVVHGVYYDTSLPSVPTEVETWLDAEKATNIARFCGAEESYEAGNSYIVCEPLFGAELESVWYMMTLAEYAVYQSEQYGWESLPADYEEGTYGYNVMLQLAGFFCRFLYAEFAYPGLGTEPVTMAHLVDYHGSPTVGLDNFKRGRNTAADILKYQVGMAVYTDIAPSNGHMLVVDPNGGVWTPGDGLWTLDENSGTYSIVLAEGFVQEIAEPVSKNGWIFEGWEVVPAEFAGWLDGAVYTQGVGDCRLVAKWSSSEPPVISGVDRWFSLSEAQGGTITLEELMSTASVMDGSVGPFLYADVLAGLENGSCPIVEFSMIDFSEEDFRSFQESGSATVTYRAVDEDGNEALLTVTVYIVASDDDKEPENRLEVRFISQSFFQDKEGNFVHPADGGLNKNSRWVMDEDYANLLAEVLGNEKKDGAWVKAPKFSWRFKNQ